MQLYSFDIFDTIVFRKVCRPTDIFSIAENMMRKELICKFQQGFKKARIQAEISSATVHKHVNFKQIYEKLGEINSLTVCEIEELKQIELETEKKYLMLNQKIVEVLKELIENGNRVVLISDMYLFQSQIRSLLVNLDNIFENLTIYVSCENGAKKATGKLYEKVRELESVEFSQWKHWGDNKLSDILMARKKGLKTVWVEKPFLFRYEKCVNVSDLNDSLCLSIIQKNRKDRAEAAYNFGLSFAGPIIYEYVEWILDTALSEGIDTLYFVLRDGYILEKAAQIIIRKRNLNIKTKTLYSSRIAWRFPSLTVEAIEKLSVWDISNWIFRDPSEAYGIYRRLHFTKDEIDQIFGCSEGRKEITTFTEFKDLMENALRNPAFLEKLLFKIEESGQLLKKFFLQEVDFSERFAFVDTNSSGKTQKEIYEFLQKEFQATELRCFYYTCKNGNQRNEAPLIKYTFDNDFDEDRKLPEALVRAPFNVLIEYCEKDSHIVPVFFESEYCAWNFSFDFDKYADGVLEFAKQLSLLDQSIDISDYCKTVNDTIDFNLKDREIWRIIEGLPFGADMKGNEILEFYPEIKVKDILRPFSKLIYFQKGSFYCKGMLWQVLYELLKRLVRLVRRKRGVI